MISGFVVLRHYDFCNRSCSLCCSLYCSVSSTVFPPLLISVYVNLTDGFWLRVWFETVGFLLFKQFGPSFQPLQLLRPRGFRGSPLFFFGPIRFLSGSDAPRDSVAFHPRRVLILTKITRYEFESSVIGVSDEQKIRSVVSDSWFSSLLVTKLFILTSYSERDLTLTLFWHGIRFITKSYWSFVNILGEFWCIFYSH